MGLRFPANANTKLVNTNLVHSVDTIVLVTDPIDVTTDSPLVMLVWYAAVSLGLGDNALTVQLFREADASGALVNSGPMMNFTAHTTVTVTGSFTDRPGEIAGQQYSLILTAGGGLADSTVLEGCFAAIAL